MVDISIEIGRAKFDNPLFAASGQATNCGEKIRKIALEGKPGGIFTKSISVDSGQNWGRGNKQPTPLCWPWITGTGRLGMTVVTAKGEPYTCDDWFENEMAIAKEGEFLLFRVLVDPVIYRNGLTCLQILKRQVQSCLRLILGHHMLVPGIMAPSSCTLELHLRSSDL